MRLPSPSPQSFSPLPCQKRSTNFQQLWQRSAAIDTTAANGNNSTAVRARGAEEEQAEGGEVAAGGGVVLARNQKQINEFMQHL